MAFPRFVSGTSNGGVTAGSARLGRLLRERRRPADRVAGTDGSPGLPAHMSRASALLESDGRDRIRASVARRRLKMLRQ
jgi:hypothetical protein